MVKNLINKLGKSFRRIGYSLLIGLMLQGCPHPVPQPSNKEGIYNILESKNLLYEDYPDQDRVDNLRDYISFNVKREYNTMTVPLTPEVFSDAIEGRKGYVCGGLSFLFMASLESLDYKVRHIELWSNIKNEKGLYYNHSTIEVYLNEEWQLHDTRYNRRFEKDDKPLSAKEIKDYIDNNIDFNTILGKSDTEKYNGKIEYFDFFYNIKYTIETVF